MALMLKQTEAELTQMGKLFIVAVLGATVASIVNRFIDRYWPITSQKGGR